MELSEATVEQLVQELRNRPLRFVLSVIETTPQSVTSGVWHSDPVGAALDLIATSHGYLRYANGLQ
jgi:hypothetical protein